jgi:hypothetical protein
MASGMGRRHQEAARGTEVVGEDPGDAAAVGVSRSQGVVRPGGEIEVAAAAAVAVEPVEGSSRPEGCVVPSERGLWEE